jgi:uncharacterized protein
VDHDQIAKGLQDLRAAEAVQAAQRERRAASIGLDLAERSLLDVLQGFVHELRTAGLPVSMTENLDAMRALEVIPISDRLAFREALAATLVKHERHRKSFDIVFEIYFGLTAADMGGAGDDELSDLDFEQGEGGGTQELSQEDLARMLLDALMRDDRDALRRLVAAAVTMFAGMEPGRPVGGTYYLYRTLRQMGYDELLKKMLEREGGGGGGDIGRGIGGGEGEESEGDIESRLLREEFEARLKRLRDFVESEIRRRLVDDRGAEALAKTLRKPLPEDVDFMHASREEMGSIAKAIEPLTRALAARLAQKRRRRHRGTLDFRKTVRASLSYGGVPADPRFKHPRPSKPEIMVVADISGSVASFARFTLMFVYTMAAQFSKVRSFVFIDGLDEVTEYFERAIDINEAVHKVNTEADVIWVDGHSDYGHALESFWDRFGRQISPKTTVLILGDARNNYHASQSWVVREMAKKARHVYWLNPEPRGYWDSGDSIVSEYGRFCDGVHECRNLRQLEGFVGQIIDH